MRWLIVLAVFLTPQPVKAPERNRIAEATPTVISQQADAPQDDQNQSANPDGSTHSANGNTGASQSDENMRIQRKLVLFTGLLVLVGFITAGVIGWQSWETRRAADFSKRSVESAMNKERARVEIIAGDVMAGNGKSAVFVNLRNGGPTLGFIKEAYARLFASGPDVEVDYAKCSGLGFTGYLRPSADTHLVQVPLEAVPNQPVSPVHFYGYARYEDVYGRIHRVQVHLRHGGPNLWLLEGKPEDNSDIEEKPPNESWMEGINEWLERLTNLADPN